MNDIDSASEDVSIESEFDTVPEVTEGNCSENESLQERNTLY